VTGASGNLNPYAQPGKPGVEPAVTPEGALIPPPPPMPPAIPEPDYSMSESEEEADNSVRLASASVPVKNNVSSIPINQKAPEPIAETSGNSNTSGSSTGSSSMPHSFSVDEIQRIRTQLKSSKSFPNAFKDKDKDLDEHHEAEGDNSSSGVSSDQEIMMNNSVPSPPKVAQQKISITQQKSSITQTVPKKEEVHPKKEVPPKKEVIISTEDAPSDEDSPPITGFQRNNSMTRKQAAIIAANRARALALSQKSESSTSVSLTQLPPPIEADSDDEVDSGKLGSSYIGKSEFKLKIN
jgi:SH3/ankyrin repeat-containing protein